MSTKKTTYKRLNDIDHVLLRGGMYIGSAETVNDNQWIYDNTTKHVTWKNTLYNPGLYKIIDEIIANAYDEFKRSQFDSDRIPVKTIEVSYSGNGTESEPLTIKVTNYGDSIPIERTEENDMWLPQMLFSELHSSSNYDDNQERDWVGTNGQGSALTNIYSKRFTVNLANSKQNKVYTQTWRENMKKCETAVIKNKAVSKGFVSIEFEPDLARFCKETNGVIPENFIEDMKSIIHTRVIQLAAIIGSSVKVYWNDEHITVNNFEKFTKLFLTKGPAQIAYEAAGERWEVAAILTRQLYNEDNIIPDSKHISFVNGSPTMKGGKHVEYVTKQILDKICELITKKKKIEVKPSQIKDSIVFFVNASIINPTYSSQTKEELTTSVTKFGSKPEFTGKLVDGLVKLGIIEEAVSIHEAKTLRDAKKTDGKKKNVIRGMSKLEDALWAGTAKSKECTLILTEGDSAKTSAISGLSIVGREKWGVFPLRGKLLNVRDITVQKFNANEELTAIKKILGLEQGKTYKDVSELRYGRVMIMTDQDHDGSHIKGLLMNLFHAEWPSLLKSGFLCTLLTPILKASKGKSVLSFYSIPEFNTWKENNNAQGWKIKYYKGLGTSTPAEAKEWFKDLHEIGYEWDDETDESINLAFNKKRADDRKKWLSKYDPTTMLTPQNGKASYTRFINDDLIHFSNADNIRSLPNIIDGLKPSQRKILYCCFKRNLKDEIKVAQLAGYVSEHAAYHHGEASLNSTIIGLAQNFVGSNNLNLLKPVGQFGSRIQGGKDASSERYIFTYLEHIVDKIFRKEDVALLKYLEDDGEKVEPEYYLPVIPMLAINGSVGIGTGFSTDIPPHKPEDVVSLIRHRLLGNIESLCDRPLDPWWFGFRGKVVRTDECTWLTKGLYEFNDDKKTITINELPVGTWSLDYKEFLDQLCERDEKRTKEAKKEAKKAETESKASRGTKRTVGSSKDDAEPCGLKSYDSLYTDTQVKFVLYFTEDGYDTFKYGTEKFEKMFKLTTSWKTTNMTCFDTKFNIVKYKTIGDILEEFVNTRLPLYETRRLSILETLTRQIEELDAKRRFIQAILDGRLELQRKTDEEIVEGLKRCDIPALSNPSAPDAYDSYDYVTKMRIDKVKQSAIIEMDKHIVEKRAEIERLENETAQSLWLSDLDDFEEAWKVYSQHRTDEQTAIAKSDSNSGTTKAAPRKRTKPSVGTKA